MEKMSRRVCLLAFAASLLALPAVAKTKRRTYVDMIYDDIARQGIDPSCSAAALVTLLNSHYGESFDQGQVWLNYLGKMPEKDQKAAMEKGLSIADICKMAQGIGYTAFPRQRTKLLELQRIGQPAILYIERAGARGFKHFVVYDRFDETNVVVKDPSRGRRRIRIEEFLRMWKGHAIFVVPTGA